MPNALENPFKKDLNPDQILWSNLDLNPDQILVSRDDLDPDPILQSDPFQSHFQLVYCSTTDYSLENDVMML